MPISRLFHSSLWVRNSPGYEQLSGQARFLLNLRSFGRFCMSVEGLQFLLCCTVWLLAGHLLIWACDIHGSLAHLPELALFLWAIPWLTLARKRVLHQLLDGRWPEN